MEGVEAELWGEEGDEAPVEDDEGGGGADGGGEGLGVVEVFVARLCGLGGVEEDLLDGAAGVEDGGGDGLDGSGSPHQERVVGGGVEGGDFPDEEDGVLVLGEGRSVDDGRGAEVAASSAGEGDGEEAEEGGGGGDEDAVSADVVGVVTEERVEAAG